MYYSESSSLSSRVVWRDYLALFLGMRMMLVLGSCLSYSTIESPRDSGRRQAKAVRFGKISLCLKSSGVNIAPPNKLYGDTHVDGMRGSFVGFSFYDSSPDPTDALHLCLFYSIPGCYDQHLCNCPSLQSVRRVAARFRRDFRFSFCKSNSKTTLLQVSPCQEALVI